MPWCGRCCPQGAGGGKSSGAGGSEQGAEGGGGGEGGGNPRNKTALKPGHSLMDWIRLGASGKDLTGVGGVLRDVSPQQLAEHAARDDAWLALRGRVYNVTHYMDFHPGGPEELLRGAGKDATDLFNHVHAWVNYESILQKCLVGRLRRDSQGASDELRAALRAAGAARDVLALPSPSPTPPTSPPAPVTPTSPPAAPGAPPDPQPRMDWFQQSSSLTLVWYASSARPAWPGARVRLGTDGKELCVALLLPPPPPPSAPATPAPSSPAPVSPAPSAPAPAPAAADAAQRRRARRHVFRRVLPASVLWPPAVETSRGKLQITFRKETPGAWASLEAVAPAEAAAVAAPAGADACPTDAAEASLQFERMRVVTSQRLTHNVQLLVLRGVQRALAVASVGQHVVVRAEVHGVEVSRRYTPVPPCLHPKFEPPGWKSDCLCLMVKGYPNGALSNHIVNLKTDDTLDVSEMDGDFDPHYLRNAKKVYLLAAGTGITPMLGIINWAQSQTCRYRPRVLLLCFNRTASDCMWAEQLLYTAEQSSGIFQVDHVLSNAGPEWSGRRGHIDLALLRDLLAPPGPGVFISACGPYGFTDATECFLKELGYTKEHYHIFEG